jgi:translation initiation factor 3 subunit L
LTPYEELFLYACPKFISANPPPYHSIPILAQWVQKPPIEPATHHLRLFLADVQSRLPTRNLRSYLKLYTSLDVRKLAGWVDVATVLPIPSEMLAVTQQGEDGSEAGERKETISPEEAVENMFSALMVLKLNGRSVCRVDEKENGQDAGPGLLDGQVINTSDVDFIVNDVRSPSPFVEHDLTRGRTLSALSNPQSEGAMPAGSSATLNTLSAFSTG